jgi:hypothetical protein
MCASLGRRNPNPERIQRSRPFSAIASAQSRRRLGHRTFRAALSTTEGLRAVGHPGIRQVDREADGVPRQSWVLLQCGCDRVIELLPLGPLEIEEPFHLPPVFRAVDCNPVTLNTAIWSAVPDEACPRGGLAGGKLAAQLLEAVVRRTAEGADCAEINFGHTRLAESNNGTTRPQSISCEDLVAAAS